MRRSFRFFPVLLMVAVMLGGAWVSLHLQAAVDVRREPLLVLDARQQRLLAEIDGEVLVTAYVGGNPRLVRRLQEMTATVRAYHPAIVLRIVNPDTDPVAVKNHDITRMGQLHVEVGGRGQRLDIPSPEGIVRTVLQLGGGERREIVHLQGSGERAVHADSGGSWRALYATLASAELEVLGLDLKRHLNIPTTADLTFVADPDRRNLAHLDAAIATYVREGGNLVYSTDTQHGFLPAALAEISGVGVLPGVVVDRAGQAIGLEDPRVIPAQIGNDAALLAAMTQTPLLPGSVAFTVERPPAEGWARRVLLQSSPQSWNETAPVSGHIARDGDERAGPLVLAWEVSRDWQGGKQRVIILGDSDLFTAGALMQGGNLELGRTLVAALADTGGGEGVDRPPLGDQYFYWTAGEEMGWAATLLLLLPFSMLLCGTLLRRRFLRRYRLS